MVCEEIVTGFAFIPSWTTARQSRSQCVAPRGGALRSDAECLPNTISFPVHRAYHALKCETVIGCVPVCVQFPCLTFIFCFSFSISNIYYLVPQYFCRGLTIKCFKESWTDLRINSAFCAFLGLQREPNPRPVITVEHFKESAGVKGLPLYPDPSRIPDMKTQNNLESDYLARDGPSSNSSFHSSEEEGTDLEGDMLDCSGSRPLLMESEEEDESCKPPQGKLGGAVPFTQPEVSTEQAKAAQGGRKNQFQVLPQPTTDGLGEPDVFATAPFRSSRVPTDDVDIFSKAPFVCKGSVAPSQPEDVFLRAPFTKKKSMEELTVAQSASQELPAQTSLLSQTDDVALLSGLDRAVYASVPSQYSMAGFAQQSTLPSHSVQAADHLDSVLPRGSSLESGGHPNDRNKGPQPQKEAVSVPMAGKPFRPQSLSKYSRHYSPEDEPSPEAQPIAAYKIVSQTNKQSIAGSVSITSLSSRTMELPAADPFALAPFPSKSGKQKP